MKLFDILGDPLSNAMISKLKRVGSDIEKKVGWGLVKIEDGIQFSWQISSSFLPTFFMTKLLEFEETAAKATWRRKD